MGIPASGLVKQHLIDPEICIRCNTCEDTCPSGAITHGANNYVVDIAKCNHRMACIQSCPTGAIDNWRTMPRAKAYSVETQMGWDSLPDELTASELAAAGIATGAEPAVAPVASSPTARVVAGTDGILYGATLPPWSAAHPYTKLYGPSERAIAAVVGNMRVTKVEREYDTHHRDLGRTPFPYIWKHFERQVRQY
jgi:benzoyl-CoA 2,3-dioxygenase component A